MKWKTFFQIMLLVIFVVIAYYFVCPKYQFVDPYTKGNAVTGRLQLWSDKKQVCVPIESQR
jgi:hypothetical protein